MAIEIYSMDQLQTLIRTGELPFGTGGTETYKPTGMIHSGAVGSRSTVGVIVTYTLPANTLNTDRQKLRIAAFGQKSSTNGIWAVQFRYGTGPGVLTTLALADSSFGNFTFHVDFVRTSATAMDFDILIREERAAGTTILSDNGQISSLDFTVDNTIDFNASVINASDSLAILTYTIEFLNI